MEKIYPDKPSVFHFLDAREFLRQACEAEKKVNKGFSHRYIAKVMGAGSSSFFKDVLNGRAPLTPVRAAKFARLFCMSPRETEYFENLVLYTQATSPDEKQRILKKLSQEATLSQRSILEASQMEYLQKWHYAAIRELLDVIDFQGDYDALGAALDPPVSESEARDAVDLLLRLGLARKNAQGRYEKVGEVVTTGIAHNPEHAKPGLKANLELARRSLETHPAAVRPFSYLTVCVSERTFENVREKLRAVRREILETVSHDNEADRLYQLNLQFFPLSAPTPRRKS